LHYNELLHQQLMVQDIFTHTHMLLTLISASQLTKKSQQAEYKAINTIVVEAKQFAERYCHNIKAGGVLWCPQVSWCIKCILY